MAASQSDVSQTLKKALYETLNAILSPDHIVRTGAEQQINVLEVTDEFGVHLTELTLDSNAPLAIRQLASVLLRQYVESHWSQLSEKFRPPETLPEAKDAIRALLPMGLQESVSKVRSSVAYAVAAIAHWDWPLEWPQLFDQLMMNLLSDNSFAVHGAMRALTEVSRDVSDYQMPKIAPIVLPQMLKIFTDPQKYSIRTRGRAVEIFVTFTEVIAAMAEVDKKALEVLLYPVLSQFTEAFVKALLLPDGIASDCGLKKDVLNALKSLLKYVPKYMVQWLPHILTPVWNSLTESANLYVSTVVNMTEEGNDPVDSDGEVIGFENLVFSLFDFILGLVESTKFRRHVQKGMSDLLYYIILYMQITEEQIRIWSNDPERFVEDEDDDSFSYSVRISAHDLLEFLGQDFEDEVAVSLCIAITKHIMEANKNSANSHRWKIHESCFLALGSLQALIVNQIQNNNLQFNIIEFLQSVVLEDLSTSNAPFLLGRCLWVASRYAMILTDDMMQRFLQATISGLQDTQPPCVRISAVRAVYGFCEQLKSGNRVVILVPYLVPLVEGLLSLAMQSSADVLSLVLESVSIILTVDDNFTASIESRIAPLAIAVFLKHNSDPVLITIAQDMFKELCRNRSCQGPLQQRLLPTLISILQAPPTKVPSGLQAASLDVLQTVVRNSIPLSEAMITQAFPAAFFCITHTDDNSIIQNGGECIRAFVSVALEQLVSWRDENGRSGLDYAVNVAELILDPRTSESATAFVGGLISTLLVKAGTYLGEKAEQLLRAVLSKMQQTEAPSVSQTFILVYAQLCRTQLEYVLEFLSGIPGPTGKSALEFVLVEWCQTHHMFFSSYENKVSVFSLSKLLEYSIKSNDPRLQEIEVKGDPIINYNEGIKTRSKAAQNPDQWTRIPLLVKIYKLLIQELANLYETFNQVDDELSDDDIDDTQDGNDFDGISAPALNTDFFGYDDTDDDNDPDITQDPLYNMNVKTFLVEYLQKLSNLPCFSTFSQHHTPQEKNLLTIFGIAN